MIVGAVLVAGGAGTRLKHSAPKAFVRVGGVSLLDRSLASLLRICAPEYICVVLPAGSAPSELMRTSGVGSVSGGSERTDSVRLGLAALAADVDTVLVHDAARPFTPAEVFDRVLAALAAGAEAVVPALPVTDTIKRVADGVVLGTVPRDDLVAVQTPQGFRRALLTRAHGAAPAQSVAGTDRERSDTVTDDAGLVEALGTAVLVVAGSAQSVKVTTPHDLHLAEAICASLEP
jgi:2-C-methyl-D-erythritol 4-phosphate cytidylyltransferase